MTLSIFDADSHVMETEDWLPSFAEPAVRERLGSLGLEKAGSKAKELMDSLPGLWAGQRDQEIGPDVISGPKGWLAPGALDTDVRSRVLDALGISAQLVFPTFSLTHFSRSKDLDVLYGGTRALNRAMTAFCEPDARLKAVGFLPLVDPALAVATLEEAIGLGVAAVWLSSEAPGDFSPAHVDLDGVWARLAEAGIPFVLHVGGGKLLPRAFHNNGQPRPNDWLGGGENLRAKDFPVLHHSPERFLACLVLDGVFERHPALRGGAIELGASWVPSFLRNIDHAAKNFSKFEPLLGSLSMKPSDYVRRALKFTPFPFEDTQWLIEQGGPELFMFSTDYPHPEGGRRPFEIFGGALSGFPDDVQQRFFWGNGAELLGLS
jgi:predicted TIM-barrel fold metal-dependent hydrolase